MGSGELSGWIKLAIAIHRWTCYLTTVIDLNFISRHAPTDQQRDLAKAKGFNLVHAGDVDAFDFDAVAAKFNDCKGTAFAVVNAAMAMHLVSLADLDSPITIGVFENCNRAPDGQPPQFSAKALHMWNTSFANTSVE